MSYTTIKPHCPDCERKMSFIVSNVATEVKNRSCRTPKCGAKWRIIVSPKRMGPGIMTHTVNFHRKKDDGTGGK